MAWSTTRRLPFTTYTPSAKRQRTIVKRTTRSLPVQKWATPETKQFITPGNLDNGLNEARISLPLAMTQGLAGDNFNGSKFRILRVRVYYDYSDLTPTSAIRMGLGMSKDPSVTSLFSTIPGQETTLPANYRSVTMLKEKMLKTDGSDHAGIWEWTGPLNVEMNDAGTLVRKNNLTLQINSESLGASLAASSRTRVEVMFSG